MSDSAASPPPRYIPVDRKQLRLETLDVERLIEDDHPARKIWRVVGQLDLSGPLKGTVPLSRGNWNSESILPKSIVGGIRFARPKGARKGARKGQFLSARSLSARCGCRRASGASCGGCCATATG